MELKKELITGGVSGAITDPNSDEALEHAELYYKEIRKMSTDIQRIAKNTDFSYSQILLIKNYLFMDLHELGGELKVFDACFEIAESWRRLAFEKKNIQPHDIILLKHELNEINLVSQGYTQSDAHNMTNILYNYAKASEEFYCMLENKKEKKEHNRNLNSGAIRKCNEFTH